LVIALGIAWKGWRDKTILNIQNELKVSKDDQRRERFSLGAGGEADEDEDEDEDGDGDGDGVSDGDWESTLRT
jgi:hypothetical protein